MSASLDLLAIGGATIDRKVRLTGPAVLGSSNPAVGRATCGGVARNVAANLAALGHRVALASVIGADAAGREIAADLAARGVTAHLLEDGTRGTAEYVAVLSPEGDLVLGLADMGLLDARLDDVLDEAIRHAGSARWVFADCNMPEAAFRRLLAARRAADWQLAVDAVSVPKVRRLPADLTGIDLLVLNADEAAAATGAHAPAADQATALASRGAAAVVVTRGADGVVARAGTDIITLPAVPARVVDVTGAGDALIAGTLSGLLDGTPLVAALRRGLRAASLTVEHPDSVRRDLRANVFAQETRA